MRLLKILAFVLGGVAAVLIAVVIVVALTFDPDRLKDELVQVVKEKKQRTLRIDGDVSLSFWPSIGAKLERVSLSEHQSAQEFAAFDTARISVQVLPLLSRRVVVDAIELDGARAALVRRKDGTLNIDDLLAKEQEKETEAVRFDIGKIRLAHTQLAYRDEKAQRAITLSDLDLSTGRIGNAASGKLQVATRIGVDRPSVVAQLKGGGDYRYDLDQKSFDLSGLDLKLQGDVAGVKDVQVSLRAGGVQARPGSGAFALDGVALHVTGKQAGENLELQLDVPKFNLSGERASGAAIDVHAKLTGAARNADVKVKLAGVEGSLQAVKIGKLALDVDARMDDTTLKGNLASPLTGDLGALVFDLPAYSGQVALTQPALPMKTLTLPLSGRARADLGKLSAALDVATRFDETQLQAKLNLPKLAPLAIDFAVNIDRINLDKYRAASPAGGGQKGTAPAAPKADKPLDFSVLKGLNANGTVSIGALQVANVKASNVRMQIKASDGKLDISPHSASLYDGTLSGALSLNAHTNALALKENLANVNINPLMKDAADKDLLEGRGNVALDVGGAGASVDALKRSLSGSARVALHDGAIKGINLAKTLREAKAMLSAKQNVEQRANRVEKTDFSELTASFRITRGIAHNDDLLVKSPFFRITGAGDINLAGSSLDYLARATVVNTSTGQGGKELDQLRGLTVPVRLSGPFDNPSYRLEFAGLATEAAKAKIEEKRQEIESKAREKVGEKLEKGLKGLLGR